MKTKLLILFLLLLAPANSLQMQDIPDCWCMPRYYPPNEEYFNEHFYYDTCDIKYASSNCDSSYWLNYFKISNGRERIFARKLWEIWFDVKAFNLPAFDSDTLIELTWRDVDSISYPEIKDSLKSIEQIFGNYKLVKTEPEYTEPTIGQHFFIYFENYVNGVSVEKKFRSIPNTYCDFLSGISKEISIDETYNSDKIDYTITPNPASEFIEIKVGANGRSPVPNEQIQIFDIYGKQMPVGAHSPDIIGMTLRIDVSQFPVGIYFVRIGNEVQKFIVMK